VDFSKAQTELDLVTKRLVDVNRFNELDRLLAGPASIVSKCPRPDILTLRPRSGAAP